MMSLKVGQLRFEESACAQYLAGAVGRCGESGAAKGYRAPFRGGKLLIEERH